jgi:hypothetical protein
MGQKKKISLKFRKISLRARVILVTFVKSNVSLVRFWVPIFLLVKILYMCAAPWRGKIHRKVGWIPPETHQSFDQIPQNWKIVPFWRKMGK